MEHPKPNQHTNAVGSQYQSDTYAQKSLNDLLLAAVYIATRTAPSISAEEIVASCFTLFPNRFSLRGYPQWPDSTVVNKRWIDCRHKNFLTGSTATGFRLTPNGEVQANRVVRLLNAKSSESVENSSPRPNELRTRAGRFVRNIETSDAFRKNKLGKEGEISEYDFRTLLLCTMESDARTLNSNLEQSKQFASAYQRKDIVDLLNCLASRFISLLQHSGSNVAIHPGMLKKKQ